MAMRARPVPDDPYNPMPPTTLAPSGLNNEHSPSTMTIRHPSPFIPIRIPVFAIVIMLNDTIVKVLNFIGGRPIIRHKAATPSRYAMDVGDVAESAEDGAARMEMKTFSNLASSEKTSPSANNSSENVARPTSVPGRVKLGARRKMD